MLSKKNINSKENLSLVGDLNDNDNDNDNKISVISSYGSTLEGDDNDNDDNIKKQLLATAELSQMTLSKIEFATKISLFVNIILFVIKLSVFIETGSFAVVAALTDSFCDLVSQMILFYTQRAVQKQIDIFPAGRTRLEPVGILIMSILMIILSCSVVFGSLFTLYNIYIISSGFTVYYSLWSVLLLVVSIILKFILYLYCKQFIMSPSAMALTEDHRNDVLSNSTALIAVCIASKFHDAVWCDPVGGLLISLYIIYSWYNIGIEESNKLIGIKGNQLNIDKIHRFIKKQIIINNNNNNNKTNYILNAYHIGRNMLIELTLIYYNQSTQYQKLCDLSIMLQYKLESFDFVERAFVNFDYKKRDKPIHKIPLLN